MSVLVQLADAVVTELNATSLSQPFTAIRLYQPNYELDDLQSLQVSVVPRAVKIANASRSRDFFDLVVDIGIQQKVDTNVPSTIDALMDFTQEVIDFFRHRGLSTMADAKWISIEHDPVMSLDHLDQHRTFTSVIRVNYRVMR